MIRNITVNVYSVFKKGKELALGGDDSIINYVNKSGYKISSFEEAL